MKKLFKIIGWTVLILVVACIGMGFYFYQTNPRLKAIVNNDESKLYYFPTKKIESMAGLPYTETALTVEESLKIYTYQFEPTIPKKANIFLIHGAGGNVSRYKTMIEPLVNGGFGVYTVDWRGFGKSNGTPNYKGVLKDTQKAFADFLTKTAPDSLKTVVYGMSLGGQLAVKITKDNQTSVDLLVLDGTVESAQALATHHAPVTFLKQKAQQNPGDFNQDYVAVRDIADIKNTPKLIIHSQKDKQVPFSQGKNVFSAAQEPKEFWETDTEHILTLRDLPDQLMDKINRQLR